MCVCASNFLLTFYFHNQECKLNFCQFYYGYISMISTREGLKKYFLNE